MRHLISAILSCLLVSGCTTAGNHPSHVRVIGHGMPDVDLDNAIYEVPVKPGISYQALVESLKSLSEGMNFVSPASFPLGEHMQKRGQDPQGIKDVRTFCNLSMGTEIILDHPEFLVFAPCRVAIYEKPDAAGKRQLYLGLDRPTHDLKNIRHPTARAQASAQQLEDALIDLMDKASRGDF
ncbi:protein of unknown function DUF302 [Methylophilus rhizosphaerae]|uniref:DUF302 domain-containing protein n=2 Tax=Methylophilus rhizosphaerae TaxID=492660 RepID=A0A1G8ZMD4_9PROT|nr:DUF302 domain-containing protein [Methylophilus rhizosphaerae]SDK15555.1 protein of unknown function DUF302 [Methylophilus rhizosphaerae]